MIYIMPLTSQTTGNGRTANAPKYFSSFEGAGFTCIPYGANGWALVTTFAVLPPADDLYAFPDDLTQIMEDADVTALAAFLANLPAMSGAVLAGDSFADAVQIITTNFLEAQSKTGAPV
jgi:hypothetical protein